MLSYYCRYPNLKTVRELIYKRGHGRVQNRRTPLSDNAIIENALGMYDCLYLLTWRIHTSDFILYIYVLFLWIRKVETQHALAMTFLHMCPSVLITILALHVIVLGP